MNKSVSFTLLIINVSVYFVTLVWNELPFYLSLNVVTFFQYHYYWTIITHMFAHSGMNHILFNMVALLFIGPILEERLGSREFLAYYLLSGALAGLFSVILYLFLGTSVFLLGASGALYAVLLAFAVFFPEARLYFFGILPIKSNRLILLYLAMNILPILLSRSTGTAYLTHLTGFLFGALYLKLRLKQQPVKRIFGE